jgi:hypothetical protein
MLVEWRTPRLPAFAGRAFWVRLALAFVVVAAGLAPAVLLAAVVLVIVQSYWPQMAKHLKHLVEPVRVTELALKESLVCMLVFPWELDRPVIACRKSEIVRTPVVKGVAQPPEVNSPGVLQVGWRWRHLDATIVH